MPTVKNLKTAIKHDLTEVIALKSIEYANKKETIRELEAQCKECRKPLESYIDNDGRVLGNGSKLAVIPYVDVDVHLKKTLRTGKQLTPDAISILLENGLEECIENVPTVREEVVEKLYLDGKITPELLQKIYTEKHSYAFSVDIKKRLDGAE